MNVHVNTIYEQAPKVQPWFCLNASGGKLDAGTVGISLHLTYDETLALRNRLTTALRAESKYAEYEEKVRA